MPKWDASIFQGDKGNSDGWGLFVAGLAALGLEIAAAGDFEPAHQLAAALLARPIANVETLKAAAERNPLSLIIHREDGEVTGMLAVLLLRAPGLSRLEAGRLDPIEPDLDLIASSGHAPEAGYLWGMAAASPSAGAAILEGARLVRDLSPTLPFFARAATAEAREILTATLGYAPIRDERTDWHRSAAVVER